MTGPCGGPEAGNTCGTILGVWAHPDDETWLSAAHMMRATAAGDRVRCITATRGELGSPDPERWPPGEPLARVRTAELDDALAVLGVDDHVWLDYPDGGCPDVPLEEGSRRVLEHLQAVRPDTVLTFGPDGMTGHPDHQSVSRWVDAALAAYDGPAPTLLWAVDTVEWLAVWREQLDALGVFMGFEPVTVRRDELRSYVALTDDERERKVRALMCQTSQLGPIIDAFGIDEFTRAMSEEGYR